MDRKTKTVFNNNRPPGAPLFLDERPPAPTPNLTRNSHLFMISPPTEVHVDRSSSTTREVVTLTGERKGPKAKNDYVDTPHSKENVPHTVVSQHKPSQSHSFAERAVISQPKSVIVKQSKENGDRGDSHEESFTCPTCGKCKCKLCTTPRELPKKWLGPGKYECSVQKVAEYCSCMCCVQFLFQTMCNDSEDQQDVSDDPCACCEQRHCCKRWLCMLCLVPFLPGLLCYPLWKGGIAICTKCYNKCNNPGCNCKRDRVPGNQRPLLDPENSST